MIWPLRYSTMVEHGRCANGSSSGFGVAKVLDAIMSPPKTELLFFPLSGLRRAGLADGFDTTNFENRAGATRGADSTNGHLRTHMFGKPLRRESFSVQVGDHFQIMIVHQTKLSILLIHTASQRRALRLLLQFDFFRLSLSLRRHCYLRNHPRG